MKAVSLAHRWLGGLLGLLLALLGLTGTLLLHRDFWLGLTLKHAGDPLRPGMQVDTVTALLDASNPPSTVVLANESLGVHRLIYAGSDAGAYADQSGHIVQRWASLSERPELWLFDLHRHLLSGDTGETIAGWAALCGLVFVVTGSMLWWRTRRTFAPRLLPRRTSRSAIVRHHRDLGIVVAPFLLVTFVTGAMMALRPVEAALLAPFRARLSLAEFRAPPPAVFAPTPGRIDWRGILTRAQTRFPEAAIRIVSRPQRSGAPIVIRIRQAGDWLPNGSTFLWFDPGSGRLAGIRTPDARPSATSLAMAEYPIHAGKVGGWVWRTILTLAGLSLTMLGTLAVTAFWTGQSARSTRYARRRPLER